MTTRQEYCPWHERPRVGYASACEVCDGTGTVWHEGGLIPLPCLECGGSGESYECPECAEEEMRADEEPEPTYRGTVDARPPYEIPAALFTDRSVSPQSKLLYAYLEMLAFAGRDVGTYREIGEGMGVSTATAWRALAELERHGYVTRPRKVTLIRKGGAQ